MWKTEHEGHDCAPDWPLRPGTQFKTDVTSKYLTRTGNQKNESKNKNKYKNKKETNKITITETIT